MENIIEQKGNFFKIKGTSDTDLEDAIGLSILIAELEKGTYITQIIGLDRFEIEKEIDIWGMPEVFRIYHQGDGYIDDTTTLRKITNPKYARDLAMRIHEIELF